MLQMCVHLVLTDRAQVLEGSVSVAERVKSHEVEDSANLAHLDLNLTLIKACV